MTDAELRSELQRVIERMQTRKLVAYSDAIDREMGEWPAYRDRWAEKLAIAKRIEAEP